MKYSSNKRIFLSFLISLVISIGNLFASELVVIDDNVQEYQTLMQEIGKEKEVVVLNHKKSGLEQIAQVLSNKKDISALHIISHGKSGEILLGDSDITLETLQKQKELLETIAASLSKNGDILLYGCDVAKGEKGKSFVNTFATLTGLNIAASTNLTGAKDKGGDWILEKSSGIISSKYLDIKNYAETLSPPKVTIWTPQLDYPIDTNDGWSQYYTDQVAPFFYGLKYFYEENGATADMIASGHLTSTTLDNTNLLFVMVPTEDFTANDVTYMSNFLNTGGRIVFYGENNGWIPHINTRLSNVITALGGSFSIDSTDFRDDTTLGASYISSTSPLASGLTQIYYSAASVINYTGAVDVIISAPTTSGTPAGFVVDQAVGNGRIMLMTDINIMETFLTKYSQASVTPYSGNNTEPNQFSSIADYYAAYNAANPDNAYSYIDPTNAWGTANQINSWETTYPNVDTEDLFLNLLTNSVANQQIVDGGGNPNAGFGGSPTVTVTASDVTIANDGATTYTVSVRYQGATASAINESTIGINDITVKDSSGNLLTIASANIASGLDTNDTTVNYTVTPPGGSWDISDSGTYTVGIVNASVSDDDGKETAGNLSAATFDVSMVPVADTTPPTFDVAPSIGSVTTSGFTPSASINEAGKIYYVVVENGATAPSVAQVKAGQDSTGAAALASGNSTVTVSPFTSNFSAITTLSANTNYDVYFVAEDDEGTPNVMAAATKVAITNFEFDVTATPTYARLWTPGDHTQTDADWSATWFTSDIIAANSAPNSPQTDDSFGYVTVNLTPSATGLYTATVDSATGLLTGDMTDTQIWIYENSFDPNNPLTNVLAVNEDINYQDNINGVDTNMNWLSSIKNVTLNAGTTYVLVVTSYTAGVTGHANFSITGPGSVGVSGSTVTSTSPAVTLSVNNATVAENSGTSTITATLSKVASEATTVTIERKSTSTATTSDDFTLSSTTITIPAGETTGTATFTSVDDLIDENNETAIIEITAVSGGEGATESGTAEQTITITDDDTAGITLSKTTTSVSESGTTDTFTVKLDTKPTSDVVIDISSGDTTEATVTPASLTFTPTDWNISQTVTITGVDDNLVDANQTTTITLVVNDGSSDDVYDALANKTVTATTTDDDVAGFSISKTTASVNESGTTDSFTVVLSKAPMSDVVFNIDSNDTSEATVSPASVTFTSIDWNQSKTVTITGANDILTDGNKNSTITVSINDVSSNDSFDSLANQTVTVTTVDNDNATPTIATIGDISTDEDFTTLNVTITPSDTDLDNLKLTVDMNASGIISIPTNSTDWIINANYIGGLTLPITAIANKSGTVELNITVEDVKGAKTVETFTITVNSVDDAPVANSMAATVGPNSVNTFDTFTPSFSDVDGDMPNTLRIETLPTVGTFETNTTSGDGSWTQITTVPFEVSMGDLGKYRFNAGDNSGQNADVNWSIRTTTLWSNTATGVVTIIADGNHSAPDVNISTSSDNNISGDVIRINEDGKTDPIYITFSDDYTPAQFLVGVIDSNDTSKVSLNDGDFNITRLSDNNVSVIITPKANTYGDVNITLGAFDGDKNGTKSFTLRITSVNDTPTALSFEKTINEDTNYSFSTLDPATVYSDTNDSTQNTNETYPDIFQIVTLPQHGQLDLNNSSSPLMADTNVSIADLSKLTYRPQENNNTDVTFTWRAYDGEAWTEIKTATIHINPVDDAPVLATISNVSKQEDASDFNITLVSSDVEGNTITYSATSSDPSKATVSIVNGKLVVTPMANKSGTVIVEVNATANGLTTSQEFNISIEPVNDAPTFDTNLTSRTILEDAGILNFELNVSDIDDGYDLNVTVTSDNASLITVAKGWDGLVNQANYQGLDFNLTTVPDASGSATITITVKDSSDEITTQSFTINVTAVNDAPVLSPISDIFVYKNSGDKNITISATDIDNTLAYSAIASNTSLITGIQFAGSIMTISLSDDLTGSSDVNVTVSDGEYNVSNNFTFKVLALMENDTVKGNGVVTMDENKTVTVRFEEDNITVIAPTQANTDGSISHEIDLGSQTIKATSELNGSVVAITDSGVHTTYSDVNLSLEVNGTILGKVSHTLTQGGKTTTATSEFVGAQTVVKRVNNKVEIETSVELNATTLAKVIAHEDGTAEHSMTTGTKTTTATAKVEGASTLITTDGNVTTSAGEVASGALTIKAVVTTSSNGKSETKFVKVNSAGAIVELIGNTVKPTTPFEAGNNVEIEDIGGTLYMKIEAPLSNTNLIIE